MCLPRHIPAWHRNAGIGFFLCGFFLPSLIPLVFLAGIDGWLATALTVAFSVGLPELLWFVAALFVGRDGLRHLWRIARFMGRRLLRRMRHSAP